MKLNFSRYAKIALIIGIILFMTPFIMVSCSDNSEITTQSGLELLVNTTTEEEIEEINETFQTNFTRNDFKGNNWLIFAILSAGLAWFLLLIEDDFDNLDVLALISSLGSVIFLITFRITYASYYGLDVYDGYIIIKTQWGYSACLLSMIIASALCTANVYYNHNTTNTSNTASSALSNYYNEMVVAQKRKEGYWECLCGNLNPPHTTGCSCGLTVSEINKRKKQQEKEEAERKELIQKATQKAETEKKIVENITSEKNNIALLKEYKDLLDSGIITQEEFDKKKQELLKL